MIYRAVESDKPKHHCGIAGIYSKELSNIPEKLFYALYSLQHRGQESAGIAYRRHERITSYKDLGMVYNVLSHYLQEKHPSNIGIGHVRYSTHGSNKIENAQPIVVSCNKGNIALAHNGNISNSMELQNKLFLSFRINCKCADYFLARSCCRIYAERSVQIDNSVISSINE